MSERDPLYVILDKLQALSEMGDEANPGDWMDAEAAIFAELVAKVDRLGEVDSELEAREQAARKRAIENRTRAQRAANQRDRLREYVKQVMSTRGWKKLEGDGVRFRLQERTVGERLDVIDIESVPERYVTIRQVREIQTEALFKAIASGEEVSGVRVVPTTTKQVLVRG